MHKLQWQNPELHQYRSNCYRNRLKSCVMIHLWIWNGRYFGFEASLVPERGACDFFDPQQQTTTSPRSQNFINIGPIVTETGSKVASWYTFEYETGVMLAPKPRWFSRKVLVSFSTLKLEQGAGGWWRRIEWAKMHQVTRIPTFSHVKFGFSMCTPVYICRVCVF